jgi:integrase
MNRSNGAEHKRKRILDDEEIRALWKACAELGTFGALLKTLLLTAQRREKVSTMQWQHLVDGVTGFNQTLIEAADAPHGFEAAT